MAPSSEAMGHIVYGFWLAALAAMLFVGMLANLIMNPTRAALEHRDRSEYAGL